MYLNRPTFLSIKHGLRLYHTIRYLKWQQIGYRFYYPVKHFFYRPAVAHPKHYSAALGIARIDFPQLAYQQKIFNPQENSFLLLNKKLQFGTQINWDYTENGMLWAFHLHYFDWLNDPNLNSEKALVTIIQYIEYQYKSKINKHAYPTSIRIVNWIKFCIRHQVADRRIVASLFEQSHRLASFPEYEIMANHLLENGFALVWAGLYLGESSFLRQGSAILQRQLKEQILLDGAHFERSPAYTSIVLKSILELLFLFNALKIDNDLSKELKINAYKVLSHLFVLVKDAPFYPNFNDSNEQMSVPFRDLVALAHSLGITYDFLDLGESGFYRFEGSDFHILFNSGQLHANYQPGHAHADAFTFVLNWKGAPIIVDPGVSVYDRSARRLLERSTMLHNTISIEGESSIDVWSSFRVGKRCSIKALYRDSNIIDIEHDGYYHKYKIKHNRKLICSPKGFHIIDHLIGWQGQEAILYLHFHPSVYLSIVHNNSEDTTVIINNKIKINFKYVELHIENYEYCLGFNQTQTAQRLVGRIHNHETNIIIEI